MAEEENKVENKVDPQDHTSPAIKKKELNYDIQDGVKETPAAEVAPMQETVTEKKRPGFFRRYKFLWIIPSVLLAIIILALIFIEPIVHACVEKILPGVLGAPVKLESVDIKLMDGYLRLDDLRVADSKGLNSDQFIKVDQATLLLWDGDLTVKNIAIANPEGFKEKNIMTLKNLKIDLETDTLSEPKLEIEELTVDGMDFYFEPSLSGNNNAKALQKYIETTFNIKDDKTGEKSTKKIQIDKLNLTNINLHVIILGKNLTIPLIDIHLENLGKGDQGITTDDLIVVMLDKLSQESTAALENYIKKLNESFKKNVQENVIKEKEKIKEKIKKKSKYDTPFRDIFE
ncbi:MAG: hypothetical protein E7040_04220 [Lentisphaerae bacterium]|nr:hypothetical protein [Lentisphaerota bacterium]